VVVVGSASNGRAALDMIGNCNPQLLILDVAMPELDGLELARKLGELADPPVVIFCTAFEDHAIEAFDLEAADYLMKPVTADRLARAVKRAAHRFASDRSGRTPSSDEEFWVPHNGRLIRISASQIERVEAQGNYMRLHLGARSVMLNRTITALEDQLDGTRFIRVHRSHIVRRDLIVELVHDGFGSWSVQLADGTRIRIGRSYLPAIRGMTGS
jgi:two-component system response regulator AlgR